QMITDNMTNVANSNALTSDPKAFAKNAKDALKGIEKNSGDLLDKAKDLNTEENRNFVQKIWDSILQIIQSIIGFITSLFNRIF
ncbi:hypothetical protein HMPREF3211_01413, partial [Staphylococcus aureus]